MTVRHFSYFKFTILATVFMEMWQREESVLELQWNLKDLKETIVLRYHYTIER